MKHKVRTRTLIDFCGHWDVLVKRLEQCGERIVRSKFVIDETPFGCYTATVWTERKEKEGGDHA